MVCVRLAGRGTVAQMSAYATVVLRKQGVVEASPQALVVLEPDGNVAVLVEDSDVETALGHLRSRRSGST